MRKTLISELRKNTDVDFRELQLTIGVASQLRDIIKRFNLDIPKVAAKLELPVVDVLHIVSGGYLVDLRLIAKIDAYRNELDIELISKNSMVKTPS